MIWMDFEMKSWSVESIWCIYLVGGSTLFKQISAKLDLFPKVRDENKKMKPPPSFQTVDIQAYILWGSVWMNP